ncbi:MAG: HAMP domain-containing protein [Candidatus Omnitrophica bacterium]|nr:HAMP domain-containing protein [Candidatus Omnitrophota bacterium]
MKIGRKLILGFFSVAVLVGSVGYIVVDTAQRSLKKNIGESSVGLAVETIDKIDRHIYSRIEEFQVYSKDLLLQNIVVESNNLFEELDDIQAYITEKNKEWISVDKNIVTPFMQGLMDNELSRELKEKIDFYEWKYGYKVFGEIFVTNKYGANVAQTGKTTDYRQDDEKWWQEAVKYGLHILDVEYDMSAKVYSTDISIRIDDENRDFIGVLKVVMNIHEAINIIGSIKPSREFKSRHFKLLNRDGMLIHNTRQEKDFQIFDDMSGEGFFSRMHQDSGFFIGHETGEEEELFGYAHSNGYKDYKGLGWILVVEHETEDIFSPVARLKNNLWIISLCITLLAVLVGILISRSILKPLKKLTRATIDIGRGRLDTKVEIDSGDEIGSLAASFNKMTEDLKTTTTSVDRLNKEIEERKKTEEHLIQAEKMGAIGKLSAGMAHEINNPLMGVLVLLQSLMSEKKKTTKEYKTLSHMEAGLKRIREVISKLLEFSRKEKLSFKMVKINDLIESTLPLISHEFESKAIVLKKEYGKDLPEVMIAGNAMQQVLMNILLNARDAVSNSHFKKITISTYSECDTLNIKIIDKGCGIKKEVMEKIFDPFFTTKPVGKGLGMGLSIVKTIIDQHNGNIDVKSQEDIGTDIIISLPLSS